MIVTVTLWVLWTYVAFVGIAVPVAFLAAAPDIARRISLFITGPVCVVGILQGVLVTLYVHEDITMTLLNGVAAMLWAGVLVALVLAPRKPMED